MHFIFISFDVKLIISPQIESVFFVHEFSRICTNVYTPRISSICTDFLLLAEFNAENLKTLKTSVEVIEVFDILEGCFYKVDVVNWVNMVYIGCLKYNKIN